MKIWESWRKINGGKLIKLKGSDGLHGAEGYWYYFCLLVTKNMYGHICP